MSDAGSLHVLVTGGTGFVGRAIALSAAKAGHNVRVLARDRVRASALFPAGAVDLIEGEILRGGELATALDGVDAIVHAAATYSYERRDARRMVEENPRLTERLFSLAQAAGVRHVVDVASAIVFRSHRQGQRNSVTDVQSPLWSAADVEWGGPYLRSKVLAEHVARRYAAAGLPITSLHPVNVVGPEDRGPGVSGSLLVRLLQPLALLAPGRSAWVDVRDVAAAAVAALGSAPGGRHLLAAQWESWRDTAKRLDRLTARHGRRIWLPARAARAAARLNDGFDGRLVPGFPTPAELEFPLRLGRVDGSSGARLLPDGYRPFDETLVDTLRWWAVERIVPASRLGTLAAEG